MDIDHNKLISELNGLLEDREHKISHLSNADPLFLLLISKQQLAAFSLLNGDPSNYYEKALNEFRKMYAEHSSQWAEYDLSLILCRQDTDPAFNETYNNIEIDPYFCQKFIIDLDNLHNDLKRLPFIPLSPKVVEIDRPVSAQTFLMKHGLNTDLARYLAVPHKKRDEGILASCINGELGKPEWHKSESPQFVPPAVEDGKNIVRLKTLSINNFRAYRKETLDLDADLIVFAGPNGLGKTSAFNAIDFLCTGGVALFDERYKQDTRVQKILGHLDSNVSESSVSATLSINGNDMTIKRNLDNRKYARVYSDKKSRADVLLQLTGLLEEPPDMRVDNLINLFRATHLFGQEFQALTSNIKDNSSIRQDTVSRMLAIQDYVEAINKSKKVNSLIESAVRRKEDSISSCERKRSGKEDELHQLLSISENLESPEAIKVAGKELLAKIRKDINIHEEDPERYDQEVTRKWRANIEVAMHEYSSKLSLTSDLEIKLPKIKEHEILLTEKTKDLTRTREIFSNNEINIKDKSNLINDARMIIRELTDEQKGNLLQLDNLKWLLKTIDDISQISNQLNELDRVYSDARKRYHEAIEKASRTEANIKNIEETINTDANKLKDAEQSIVKIGVLQRGIEAWIGLKKLCSEKEEYAKTNEEALENTKKELVASEKNYEMMKLKLHKQQEEINRLQEKQSERLNLLDGIQQFIDSNVCPVCGVEHSSKDELVEKLQIQKGTQTEQIKTALQRLEAGTVELENISKKNDYLEVKINKIMLDLAQVENDLMSSKQRISGFERICYELGISTDLSKIDGLLNNEKVTLEEKLEQLKAISNDNKGKLQKLRNDYIVLEAPQKQIKEEMDNLELKRRNLQSTHQNLLNEAVERQVSLEKKEAEINLEIDKTKSLIESMQMKLDEKTRFLMENEKELKVCVDKKNELEDLVKTLEREIITSEENINEVNDLIKQLEVNLERETIADVKRKLEAKISVMEALQKEVINYEISLDTVQTSASIARLKQEIKNLERELNKEKSEIKQYGEWGVFFEEVHGQLEKLRKKTLTNYTSKYGPLSSLIQRRLRQVYGFGDIKLLPEGEGITVRVSRHKMNDIAPNDYFSESQIQILMLSLFMSAALTQTWSSFAPVLLDDPVTHFDDLNAYSFIELIKGLVLDSEHKRQFIISTCEDRLYRLMYQKFKKLDERVIFYKFESIGEKGPKIKRVR